MSGSIGRGSARPRSGRPRLIALALVAALTAWLALPAAGLAQDARDDPADAQYGDANTRINENIDTPGGGGGGGGAGGAPAAGNGRVGGSLPFSGLDLIGLAALSVSMISGGLLIRRLLAPNPWRP
jgi:hypothetical protein